MQERIKQHSRGLQFAQLTPRLVTPSETQKLEKKRERRRAAMDSRAVYTRETIRGLHNARTARINSTFTDDLRKPLFL